MIKVNVFMLIILKIGEEILDNISIKLSNVLIGINNQVYNHISKEVVLQVYSAMLAMDGNSIKTTQIELCTIQKEIIK